MNTKNNCKWEMCNEEDTQRVSIAENDPCPSCRRLHTHDVKLCQEHLHLMKTHHAVQNMARLALGIKTTYRSIKVIH